MEMLLREMCQVMFSWWWYVEDGQTKTANAADTYVLPVLVAISLCCLMALLAWKW
ncbi:MAG TPA: hypothetical protein PLX97_06770 [Gemmatales bacterium]|nr:hypothetical protein [Gemmatales bacterium]